MASTFDRIRFAERLATRRLGHTLFARAEVGSTNDVAWEALAAGAPDGTVVVADAQTRGRGRAGRTWEMAPGRGLALSVALRPHRDRGSLAALPLAAGLATAQALETLGARPSLKWPNDVLLGGRKVAGVLCESRRNPASPGLAPAAPGGAGGRARRAGAARGALLDLVVVGVGVNVAQVREDFPPELAAATSLALEGTATEREVVAAAFLNALEPLWRALEEGARAPLLEAWRARAGFWGCEVAVQTPVGEVRGVAQGLDEDGALVLALAGGGRSVVLAGDLEWLEGEGA